MQPIFAHLQTLDATPDRPLIDAYNRHVARNHPAFRLIVNKQVRPAFSAAISRNRECCHDQSQPGVTEGDKSERTSIHTQVKQALIKDGWGIIEVIEWIPKRPTETL